MYAQLEKKEHKSRKIMNSVAQKKNATKAGGLIDNRGLRDNSKTREVIQAYGRVQLSDNAPVLTPFDTIKDMDEDDEVVVARGIVPIQWDTVNNQIVWESYVTHPKMLQGGTNLSKEDADKPKKENIKKYVQGDFTGAADGLIEFTSRIDLARNILQKEKGFIYYVKIKRKFIENSSGGEQGWMANLNAPYDIIYGEAKKKRQIQNEEQEETKDNGSQLPEYEIYYDKMTENDINNEWRKELELMNLYNLKKRKSDGNLTIEDRQQFAKLLIEKNNSEEAEMKVKYLVS